MPANASQKILARLTPLNVTQWTVVGQAIRDLKQISKASPEGTPWLDIVGERAADLGHPVSKAHLFRVNRVFDFATRMLEELDLPEDLLSDAKIGTLDAVERLHRFEEEEGVAAFRAATDRENRATLQEINQRYVECKARHPDRRDPKQIGAERRYADKTREDTSETSVPQLPTEPADDAVWISVMKIIVARVEEAERTIQAHDRRIKKLEAENQRLRQDIEQPATV